MYNLLVQCPYCGILNSLQIDDTVSQYALVCCSFDENGCDKHFVVDVVVSVSTKSLKIEGDVN